MACQTTNIAYHYTSIDILLKLLDGIKDDHFVFHGSYILNMNDPTEFKYGFKQIIEILPKIEDELLVENKDRLSRVWNDDDIREMHLQMMCRTFRLPFVVCFSNNRDHLPQWGMYGDKGRGVSLGFDIQDYYRIIRLGSNVFLDMTNNDEIKLRAIRVSYKHISNRHSFVTAIKLFYKKYLTQISDIEDEKTKCNLKLDTLSLIAYFLSSLIKHKAYSYEAESRVLYPCLSSSDVMFKMNSRGQLTPYIDVGIEKKRLKKIIVGPCCDYDSTKLMLEAKLNQIGLNHIKILRSEIPYRL
jgi:hypothetical protein